MKYNSTYDILVDIVKILDNGGGGECNNEELLNEIKQLEAQIGELQTTVSDLTSDVEAKEEQITQLTNEVGEKQAYIDTAKGITITENGTYTPEKGVVGYNEVIVNIQSGGEGNAVLSNGTKLGYSAFKTVPKDYDFSNISDFSWMFYNCSSLTEVPQFNTSKCTNFDSMFNGCKKLTEVPLFNTSNGTGFSSMFQNCTSLVTAPLLDTSKGTTFNSMFVGCPNLTTIPQLNVSNGTNFNSMFNNCTSLTDVTFVGSINKNITFSSCTKLTYDSIKSILTACAATTNTTAKTLKFSMTIADTAGELAALVTACTSKGWTISGLTLN